MPAPALDVAILGFGPTGAALAKLLGEAGLSVVVIDREPAPVPLPRAVHFDGEVMRIFQSMGLDAALAAHVRPSGGMLYMSPEGECLIERKPATAPGPHGWMQNYLFHQPFLEATLREGVARHANVEVLLAHEAVGVTQTDEAARLALRAPDGGPRTVEAKWVVGCDGARSLVRAAMGVGQDDLGLHQPWLVVDVVLKRPVHALPHATVQYCEPARPTTYVNVVGDRRRWEIMLMPGDVPDAMVTDDAVWSLLGRWITPEDAVLERRAVYTFHSLIAQAWRHGRLLLAGDAAHQTPPFLGQGMCAGIRDAANLAWKLARVVKGGAKPTLLDTYATEREPHVRAFIDLAVRLGDIIQTTDPAVAAERDRRFRAGGPEQMINLSPALGPGFHVGAAPAGEIFPQPLTLGGARLDAVIGNAFAVIGTELALSQVDARTRSAWAAIGAKVVDAEAAGAERWLGERGLVAVLLRPDRYVAATARSVDELVERSAVIAGRLFAG